MIAPVAVDAALLRTLPLPRHESGDDKDARGKVLVIGGGRAVPGAALLAAVAALRAGAGKLQIATVESVALQLGLAVPEALMVSLPERDGEIAPEGAALLAGKLDRLDAALIGPGMLNAAVAAELVARLTAVECEAGFVLDAGALIELAPHRHAVAASGARIVMTPHAGEMAALTGSSRDDIAADPLTAALDAARQWNAVIALKGGETHIAAPDGRCWRFADGNVGLATSGSGDTLAGVVAGLLARGCEPHIAAIWGVWLHGEAGNRLKAKHGPVGFLARELLAEIPSLMAEFG